MCCHAGFPCPGTVVEGVRVWLLLCGLLLVGCTLDPRPQALRRGLDQVRSVLADPRLQKLAQKSSQGAWEERLVDALFSPAGRGYWPPHLPAEVDYSYQDQSHLPGRIAYLRQAELPWAVVVEADPEHHQIRLLGYGMHLDHPLLRDTVPVLPPTKHPDSATASPVPATP